LGWTAMHLASRHGHAAVVKALVSGGGNVHIKIEQGNTPLHLASINGYATVVKALLAGGANVHVKNECGNTPLHWASRNGFATVVEVLIAKGADVNAKAKGAWTALRQASYNGHASVAEVLIANGADVHAKEDEGASACNLAMLDNARANRDDQTPVEAALKAAEAKDLVVTVAALNGDTDVVPTKGEDARDEGQYLSAVDSGGEVAKWLLKFLPRLQEVDAVKYRKCLTGNGFDSSEMMNFVRKEDLDFMKIGHKRALIVKSSMA